MPPVTVMKSRAPWPHGCGSNGLDCAETIVLDARLVNVLKGNAFTAELDNGFRFVAYRRRTDGTAMQPGQRVSVRFSPYDMSRGQIVDEQETWGRHEGR